MKNVVIVIMLILCASVNAQVIKKDTIAYNDKYELVTNKSGKEVFRLNNKRNIYTDKESISNHKSQKGKAFVIYNKYANGEYKLSKFIIR